MLYSEDMSDFAATTDVSIPRNIFIAMSSLDDASLRVLFYVGKCAFDNKDTAVTLTMADFMEGSTQSPVRDRGCGILTVDAVYSALYRLETKGLLVRRVLPEDGDGAQLVSYEITGEHNSPAQ